MDNTHAVALATEMHPFDHAIALTGSGPDNFVGHTSPAYWNMVGPFGGISAAVVLNGVMQHSARLGEPVALTINYASGMAPGPFSVAARAARTNRSTQHWVIEVMQRDEAGRPQIVLTATVLTALRRRSWSGSDLPMPLVAPPGDVPLHTMPMPMEWLNRYEIRAVYGHMPTARDGTVQQDHPDTDSLTRYWMRDLPARPLDFCALAALVDVFYPRVYLRRQTIVPVGTVSLTVYFHAGTDDLQACSDGYVFGQARGQEYRNGFFDQSAQLWSESGTLLVNSQQIVYYKE